MTTSAFFTEGHQPQEGSIWRVKNDPPTEDRFILIVDEVFELEKKQFVRVRPISLAIEMAAADDHIHQQEDLFENREFIAPYWNEQPIGLDRLIEQIGRIRKDGEDELPQEVVLTEKQKEFRCKEIEDTEFLRQEVMSIPVWEDEVTASKKYTTLLAVAASISIAVFLLWPARSIPKEDILNQYAIAYPFMKLSSKTHNYYSYRGFLGDTVFARKIDTSYSIGNSIIGALRGGFCGDAFFSEEECSVARRAMGQYAEGEYGHSIDAFRSITGLISKSPDLAFYSAVAELLAAQADSSLAHLRELDKISEFPYQEAVDYYMALAFIELEEYEKAESVLSGILRDSSHEYHVQSGEILELIR